MKLREAILRINVVDLRQRTHEFLYETYRRNSLQQQGYKEGDDLFTNYREQVG